MVPLDLLLHFGRELGDKVARVLYRPDVSSNHQCQSTEGYTKH